MGKLCTRGFTNYFGDKVLPVELLSYDNNKYVEIRLPSGVETEVKTGYIYADEVLSRRVAHIHWHILGGGKRANFKRRYRRTEHDVRDPSQPGTKSRKFTNQQEAVTYASRLARRIGQEVEVFTSVFERKSSFIGSRTITCLPNGDAIRYRRHQRTLRRVVEGSYLRGFGKFNGPF